MRARQRAVAITVLVAAVGIVALASPVLGVNAASVLDTGAQHTNDSEFGNANELTNMSVEGSGVSASVVLGTSGSATFSDGFEDEPADSGVPDDWAQDDDGSFNVSTTKAANGSQSTSLKGDGDGNARIITNNQPYSTAKTENLSVTVYSMRGAGWHGLRLKESGSVVILMGMRGGDLKNNDGSSDNTVSTVPDKGEHIELTLFNFRPGSDQYDLRVKGPGIDREFEDLAMRGDMTNGYETTQLNVQSGSSGEIAFFDDFQVGGSSGTAATGRYVGTNETVDDAAELAINRTLLNGTMNATLRYHDKGSWPVAAHLNDTNSSTSNTTVSLSRGGTDTYRLYLNLSDEVGTTTAELHDYSILFDSDRPTLKNASASPNGTKETQRTVNLSIPVNDTDFGGNGDTLEVDFYLNGTLVNTTTIQSNQTVEYEATVSTGGPKEWAAVAHSTEYDEAPTASDNHTFETPGSLLVRNETRPSEAIDYVEVELQFFFDNDTAKIVTRNTSDGSINMTGLPADTPFVVVADASGFHPRRIYLESLFDQQRIYLLNTSVRYVETTFKLEDFSGRFPESETVLQVQRPINDSWQTVLGDRFGATGQFPGQLEYNTKHRLVLINTETGARLILKDIST